MKKLGNSPEYLLAKRLIPNDFPECDNYRDWFSHFQGNILHAFTGDEGSLIGFRFRSDSKVSERKKAIAHVSHQFLTSANYQHFSNRKDVECNVLLSVQGYQMLGIPEQYWPRDHAFRTGLRLRGIGDIEVDQWETSYQEPIHFAFLLRANARKHIVQSIAEISQKIENVASLDIQEAAGLKYNEDGKTIEAFGFVDGISQPIFFESEMPSNQSQWDPSAQASLVLESEAASECGFGSYLVYRKLAQDLIGFERAVDALVCGLNLDVSQRSYAEALIIGRFKDGTPLALAGEAGAVVTTDDFDYSTDIRGNRCPLQAHVRKMNPRGEVSNKFGVKPTQERLHRIVRRSLIYGDFEAANEEVGMLFCCFQSNISAQFEVLQEAWANRTDFVQPDAGLDPLIGQSPNVTQNDKMETTNSWPMEWNKEERTTVSLSQFVHLRGGEYFYLPSPDFFNNLI